MAKQYRLIAFALLMFSTIILQRTSGQTASMGVTTDELANITGTSEDVRGSTMSVDNQTTTEDLEDVHSNTISVTYYSTPEAMSSTSSVNTTETPTETPWSWTPVTWEWNMILQLTLGILGLLGNLLVMVVLFKRRSQSRSTDTLIGALAFADFLTSVLIIPIPIADQVPSTWVGELYCRILYTSFFMWLSVTVSIFTLTTIAIERFIAVLFPIKFNRMVRKRHIVFAILIIWILAIVVDCFIPLVISVDSSTQSCVYSYSSQLAAEVAGVTSFLFHFIFPSLIMLGTQAVTAHALYRQALLFGVKGNESTRSTSSYRLLRAKNRVIKLLVVVILVFIVCWGPNSIGYFLYNIGVIDYTYLYSDLNRILTLLAFINSCANPLIYTIQYPQFRMAIRELFTGTVTSLGALFEGHIESPNINNSGNASCNEKSMTQMSVIPSHI